MGRPIGPPKFCFIRNKGTHQSNVVHLWLVVLMTGPKTILTFRRPYSPGNEAKIFHQNSIQSHDDTWQEINDFWEMICTYLLLQVHRKVWKSGGGEREFKAFWKKRVCFYSSQNLRAWGPFVPLSPNIPPPIPLALCLFMCDYVVLLTSRVKSCTFDPPLDKVIRFDNLLEFLVCLPIFSFPLLTLLFSCFWALLCHLWIMKGWHASK